MEIFYENHLGKKVNLMKWPIVLQEPEKLFNSSWKYNSNLCKGNFSKITSFYKEIAEKPGVLEIFADTRKEYSNIMNQLLQIFEEDIYGMKPGKIFINGYYLSCYIIESKYSDWLEDFYSVSKEVKIVSENPVWLKEKSYSFFKITNEIYNEDGLDYPYDYPYDYANSFSNRRIQNENFIPSNFIMTIYGSCENPYVTIGEWTYSVNTSLITGEYLIINSVTKKIYKVKNSGEKENLFDVRGRDFYIFEKIPNGMQQVVWDGSFGFDITLMYERGEPEWI